LEKETACNSRGTFAECAASDAGRSAATIEVNLEEEETMTNIGSLILIKGTGLEQKDFKMSLSNAKQIVVGYLPMLGMIVHLTATSFKDRDNALVKFAQVEGVKDIITLTIDK
jgi:hypothetical protein